MAWLLARTHHVQLVGCRNSTPPTVWRGLSGFEEQASLRSWLYRVATNRCLDALRALRKRWRVEPAMLDIGPPEPTRSGQVLWLQPYPDVLLAGVIDQTPGPEAPYEAREAIYLAASPS